MDSKYAALFQPLNVGKVTLKNRVILCAMGGTSPFEPDGYKIVEGIGEYYRERAKGGVSLIIPGATMVKVGKHYIYEYEDAFTGPLKDIVDDLHSYGTKFFLQLGAGFGRAQFFMLDSEDEDIRNTLLVSPADGLQNVWNPDVKHRGLKKEEIREIVEAFGKTAVLCKKAGIDGIEIHAVHEGYLLDQFAITNTNGRTDEYGGSLENRLRFACEIIKEIHRAAGDDFAVSVRYSVASKMRGFNAGALPAEDFEEFGRTLEESPKAAQILEAAGADMLNADNGSYDSWWWAHPPVYMPLHCNYPEVSYLKNYVSIPVFCAGRMEDPEFASNAVQSGSIDGIGVARQFLADPYWLKKVEEGRLDEIRPCIACHNGCFPIGPILPNDGRDFMMGHCALRPATMAEEKWKLIPSENPKKIAVVGGGIAGMEAARILTKRGHKVTLFEKTGELGGVFIAAASPSFKEKDRMLIKWYIHQLELLNVEVCMNHEAKAEELNCYDEVIVATGATPRQLRIEGIDAPGVVQAIDFLRGRESVGDKVVIIGGGLTGVEIAYQLVLQGKTPVIVEMLPDILQVPGLCAANSNMLREIIRYYNIEVHTNAALQSIRKKDGLDVEIKTPDGTETISADSVILSVGYIPESGLADRLKEQGVQNISVIGDARKVGNLMSAVYSAYDTAYKA